VADQQARQLSEIERFVVKAGTVTACIVIILFFAVDFVDGLIARKADQFAVLRGGSNLWIAAEQKLYDMADRPDLPPEQKQRIIEALRRISDKYRPYIEALNGQPPASPPPR
jgi:hypothetical protein